MAIVAFDTFTDTPGTDLVNHTPDSGGAWEEHGVDNAGQAVISNENRARGNAAATVSLLHTVAPPTADYSVRGTMHVKSVAGACGLVARSQSDEQTAVTLGYNAFAGVWVLAELVDGVIGESQFIPATLDEDTDYELELVVEGDTVAGYVDGELLASIKTEVLDAGRAGLSFLGGSDSTGLHIDDWSVDAGVPTEVAAVVEVEYAAAAALRATRRIAASLECETDADIEASIARLLASVAEVEPDAAALVRPTRGVTAAVEGEGDAATAVQPARSIAAPLESETELHAQLVVTAIVQFAAVLEAEGDVAADVRATRPIAAAAESEAISEAAAELRRLIRATLAAEADAVLVVQTARNIAAVVDAEVDVDAVPEVRRLLAAQLAADADAAVPLHVARALAAALEADVDASAALFLATLLITTLSVQVVGAARSPMASVVAGPAVRRVVAGPALSRRISGPVTRVIGIEGPATA